MKCEEPAEERACGDEDSALCQQHAQQGPAASTEGATQGEFAFANGVARNHEHDDVDAGDDEYKCDQAHEHSQGFAIVAVGSAKALRGQKR